MPENAVDQESVPEPFVFRKPLVVCDEGQVYVCPANVVAPEIEAVPPTSSLVSNVPP